MNKNYIKPTLEVVEVNVEYGFATSSDGVHKLNERCWCGEIHHSHKTNSLLETVNDDETSNSMFRAW